MTRKLPARQVALLQVLSLDGDEQRRGMYAGRLARLAGFRHGPRMDAGTTRTLNMMGDLVRCEGDVPMSRRWFITEGGRKALGEFAFGE